MQKLPLSKIFLIVLLLVSVVGFIDATYLTAKHFLDDPVTCSILEGCETVTTSEYSTIFNIPIALFGMFYYLFVSILLFLYMEGVKSVLKFLVLSTAVGFLSTLYLIFLQAFVLNAFCLYCLISAATSISLFAGSIFLATKFRKIGSTGGI